MLSVVSTVVDWRAKSESAKDAVSVACPWARERTRTPAGEGLQPPSPMVFAAASTKQRPVAKLAMTELQMDIARSAALVSAAFVASR